MKHAFHAARDILNDKAEVLVKKGEVAVTVESDLPIDRVFAGLQTGQFVPKKDVPAEHKKPAKKDAPADAKTLKQAQDEAAGKGADAAGK